LPVAYYWAGTIRNRLRRRAGKSTPPEVPSATI